MGRRSSCFPRPANGAYRQWRQVPFGEKISLPEPFEIVLDTDEF